MPQSYYNPAVLEPMQFGPDFGGIANSLMGFAQIFGQQQMASNQFSLEKLRLNKEAVKESYDNVLNLQREQRAAQNDQFVQTMEMTKLAAQTEMQRQQAQQAQLQLKNAAFDFDMKVADAESTKALTPLYESVGQSILEGDQLSAMAKLETLRTDKRYASAKSLHPLVAEMTTKMGSVSIMTDSGPRTLAEVRNMLTLTGSAPYTEALRAILQNSNTALTGVDEKGNTFDRSEEFFGKLSKLGVGTSTAVEREQIKSLMSSHPRPMSPSEKAQYDQSDAALRQRYTESIAAAIEKDPNDFKTLSALELGFAQAREANWQMYRYGDVSPFRSSKEMLIGTQGPENLQKNINVYHEALMEANAVRGVQDMSPEAMRELNQGGVKAFLNKVVNPFSAVIAGSAEDLEALEAAQGVRTFGNISLASEAGEGVSAGDVAKGAAVTGAGYAAGSAAATRALERPDEAIARARSLLASRAAKGLSLSTPESVAAKKLISKAVASKAVLAKAGLTAVKGGGVVGGVMALGTIGRGVYDAMEINQRNKAVNYDFARLKAATVLLSRPETATIEAQQQLFDAINHLNPELKAAGMGQLDANIIFGGTHWRMIERAIQQRAAMTAGFTSPTQPGLTPSYPVGTLGVAPVAPQTGGFAGGSLTQ